MKRFQLFAVLGVLALLAAGCNVNWAQFRADATHSGSQSESAISSANVGSLGAKWATALTGAVKSSPAVVSGVAYVSTLDGKVDALDVATGAVTWTTITGSATQYSSPAVAGGVVYVGSDDHKVYALDATTGAVKWSTATGGIVESSPTVVSGVVYVGSEDDKLYALNASTGAVNWTVTTGNTVDSSPAVANGIVYVGSADGKVWARDASTGAVKWTATTGGGITSSPAVANGVVYVGSADHKVWALDAISGATKWTVATGAGISSSPAVANGVVYIGSDDTKVWALDAVTGATKWTATTGGKVESSPAVANGLVYVGSDDTKVYGLDATTGANKWTGTTTGVVFSSPAVANGVVYVGSNDGKTRAFTPWSFTRPTCASNPHSGLSPCQIQDAYRLPSQVAGTGRTVAIVDAYDNPNAETDLAIYRTQYGLPACTTANGCFKKLNQSGVASSYPTGNPGWGIEISLDLDAVSAACPLCHITLVEANSASTLDLDAAEDTAAAQSPTSISNSWGAGEFVGENTLDGHFTHPGIPITVSTGDSGYGAAWPAASPNVTAVGGTQLVQDTSTRGWSETVWSGAGSGCSTQEAKPTWQTDSGCPSNRTIADVSALAGSPGLAIYDSYSTGGPSDWLDYGGTSLAAPLVGAVYALAYPDYTSAVTYTHAASLFDITSGSTGSCGGSYLCTGVTGYDGPTGLGTPCGTSAFGSGPFISTCPAPGSGAAAPAGAAPESTPPLTPACPTAAPGQVRCFAYKIGNG
jgi:outer membrane protein assembly factor BamB